MAAPEAGAGRVKMSRRRAASAWMRLAAAVLGAAIVASATASCSSLMPASGPIATKLVLASTASDEAQAATLISSYRAANGLSPVIADPTLARAAEVQARAVASVGALSHGDFASRMASLGIKGEAAENLSAGRNSVAAAIAGWKASPDHNENLLLARVRRIGIARIDTPGVGYHEYWVLVLAR